MRLFDKRSTVILLIICLPLLFMPKVNFIGFSRQSAGVRIDDLILLGFATIFFWAHFSLERRLENIEKAVLSITGFCLFSFIINKFLVAAGVLHVSSNLFYCIRLFEYSLFFYIGLMASRLVKISSIMKSFLLWNVVLMLLQKAGYVGLFTVDGYVNKGGDRIFGIASFGSEMGMLFNLLFCFLIYDEESRANMLKRFPRVIRRFFQVTYTYWLVILLAGLVTMTGARMAILTLGVSFLFRMKDEVKWKSPITLVIPLIALAISSSIVVDVLYNHSDIIGRSAGLMSLKNVELIQTVWDNIPIDYDPIGKETILNTKNEYDLSWWMRIHKWCYALKIYALHPECWLQGVGPGFTLSGLDGGYVRILTETGIIGCGLYGWFFYLIAKQNRQLKWMMVSFLVNMVFFDVYLAYKPMSLLFLVTGFAYAAQQTTDSVQVKSRKLAYN